MFLCVLSIFVGYGDRIVNLTMGWFAIKLYQAEVTKMSRTKRSSVGRDKGQGSEEGRVAFAVGDHQVPVACLALERYKNA